MSCAVYEDRRTTVASYLREWSAAKKDGIAPTTYAGDGDCVEGNLIPAFGHCRLPRQKADRRRATIDRALAALPSRA
ncbi:hypothetical protein OG535_29880 [Kitasatospora sp. NBC_00085]|uniref:hypothetical protein n=1 Tax=unclassified Kitasatospora TaxID=2633591 RepID=UPI0032439566